MKALAISKLAIFFDIADSKIISNSLGGNWQSSGNTLNLSQIKIFNLIFFVDIYLLHKCSLESNPRFVRCIIKIYDKHIGEMIDTMYLFTIKSLDYKACALNLN